MNFTDTNKQLPSRYQKRFYHILEHASNKGILTQVYKKLYDTIIPPSFDNTINSIDVIFQALKNHEHNDSIHQEIILPNIQYAEKYVYAILKHTHDNR